MERKEMIDRQRICGLASALWAIAVLSPAATAATGSEPPQLAAPSGTIDPNQIAVPAKPGAVRGNPLWAIPLSSLSIARERPIFAPSRRPAAPVVIAAPPVLPTQPAKPTEANRLNLALIGTVISSTEGIGIFLDQPSQRLVRLKTGEQHAGWILRSVRAREVTLENGARVQILSLPQPGAAGPRPEQQL
jgi:general secretion pathway protein N